MELPSGSIPLRAPRRRVGHQISSPSFPPDPKLPRGGRLQVGVKPGFKEQGGEERGGSVSPGAIGKGIAGISGRAIVNAAGGWKSAVLGSGSAACGRMAAVRSSPGSSRKLGRCCAATRDRSRGVRGIPGTRLWHPEDTWAPLSPPGMSPPGMFPFPRLRSC